MLVRVFKAWDDPPYLKSIGEGFKFTKQVDLKKKMKITTLLLLFIVTSGCTSLFEKEEIKIVHKVPLGPFTSAQVTHEINETELQKIIKGIGKKNHLNEKEIFGVYFQINTEKIGRSLNNVNIKFETDSDLISNSVLFDTTGGPLKINSDGTYYLQDIVYPSQENYFVLKGITKELPKGIMASDIYFEITLLENNNPVMETWKSYPIKICKYDDCRTEPKSSVE